MSDTASSSRGMQHGGKDRHHSRRHEEDRRESSDKHRDGHRVVVDDEGRKRHRHSRDEERGRSDVHRDKRREHPSRDEREVHVSRHKRHTDGSHEQRHKHRRSQSPGDDDTRHRSHHGHRDGKHHHRDSRRGNRSERRDGEERKDIHASSRHAGLRVEDDDNELAISAPLESTSDTAEHFLVDENAVSSIPTSRSLHLQSKAPSAARSVNGSMMPQQAAQETQIRRDDWMLSREDQAVLQGESSTPNGDIDTSSDFFSSLGDRPRERTSRQPKTNPEQLQISSRELNTQLVQGKHLEEYDDPRAKQKQVTFGGPGHQWRMMKLRRVYEAADEEGRNVEEVAMERYGSMDAFNEARAERQHLDDQQSKLGTHRQDQLQPARGSKASSRAESPQVSAASRPLSRQSSSFRKPGEGSGSSTPQAPRPTALRHSSILHGAEESKPSTPVPSVFAPLAASNTAGSGPSSKAAVVHSQSEQVNSAPPLDPTALNKLSAKVMRAEMMGAPDATELRTRLEAERARVESGGDKGFSDNKELSVDVDQSMSATHVQVLPTLDARGRLYDVGKGRSDGNDEPKGRRKENKKFETRDSKTGELLRYNADDDQQTLADLVREEKFSAGMASQKNMDAELASHIMGDKSFKAEVDYLDDNVERMARKKMKSDAMKRQFAINDFARTKKALDTCTFCWQDDTPPKANIVSTGTRAYLALPDTEPFVPGHCQIVPMQHHLCTLEADEDTWEEMKNFMKCLIQMNAEQHKGVVFFETVKSLKQQRHTFIEAMPVAQELFAALPSYFRQSILEAGDEWSQNKKLITFSSEKPFRNALVPQLPYFMVQFDHRGAKGFGHVIERGDGFEHDDNGENADGDLGSRGGSGDFPRWFAAEVIGNLLEYEPRQWRKPRRLPAQERGAELARFKQQWARFDWTPMLQAQSE